MVQSRLDHLLHYAPSSRETCPFHQHLLQKGADDRRSFSILDLEREEERESNHVGSSDVEMSEMDEKLEICDEPGGVEDGLVEVEVGEMIDVWGRGGGEEEGM